MNRICKDLVQGLMVLTAALGGSIASADEPATWDGKLVQVGKMHEATGQQQHQGRVQLKKLLERPHFFGVAALEKLDGEATIYDGNVTLTRVDANGKLESKDSSALDAHATLLVGAYVPSWTEQNVGMNVPSDKLDQSIAEIAAAAGLNVSAPFVFTMEGEFSDLRLHVIHGACPMHARLKNIELPKEKQPLEIELEKVRGRVVGVFAKDAVGSITHPATSTHMHLLFTDTASGRLITGHVEQVGLTAGAIVRLPKYSETRPKTTSRSNDHG